MALVIYLLAMSKSAKQILLPPEQDLDARLSVWEAMHWLFMDTDVRFEYDLVATACAKSQYTLENLEAIFLKEVFPACKFNLNIIPGGEWSGFDSDWLQQRILKKHRFGKSLPWNWRRYALECWAQIESRILVIRDRDEHEERLKTMQENRISRFPVPKLEDLPSDIRSRIEAVQEKAGFIPNVFIALAHRPDEFRAFFAYHDALILRASGLSKAEKEMIIVATSAANNCHYCVIAHGAILRVYAKNALLADQIAVNYLKADISERQKAMLAFALKVATNSHEISDTDYSRLRTHDFSDEDIWDIGAITALFALSNRMANLISMRPNDEFYSLGR